MKKIGYSFIFCLMMPILSKAALNLEVTKGVKGLTPIGVTPFDWQGAQKTPPVDFEKLITQDLQNSGKFSIVFGNNQLKNGQPELTRWQQKKVNALLTGSFQDQGNNQYQVQYTLTNVYKNPGSQEMNNSAVFGVDSGAVLAQQHFLVTKDQLRKTAHKIANQVYQKLTGKPGVFLTKLAYVLVTSGPGGRPFYHLVVSDYDGSAPQIVLSSYEPILSPAWSPDARSLAYVAYQNNQAAVYVTNLKSGQRRSIASYAGVDAAPAFSPDGQSLVVALSKDGGVNLYKVNLQSGALTALTNNLSENTSPVFSSDGKALYFTSTQGGEPQIYQFDLSQGAQSRVSFSGIANMDPTAQAGVLAYLQQVNKGIYQVVVNQNGNTIPVSGKGFVYSPTLSPDASMLVYSIYTNGEQRLVLETLSLGQQQLLPGESGAMRYPAWSPIQ